MTLAILGIDLGKNSCSVVGVDERGAVFLRRTMRRGRLIELVSKLPTSVVAMEARCSAHHSGRILVGRGHTASYISRIRAPLFESAEER